MSVWQLTAQVDGYVEANTPPDKRKPKLSEREFNELSSYMDKVG